MSTIYIKLMTTADTSRHGFKLIPIDTEKHIIETGYWPIKEGELPEITDTSCCVFPDKQTFKPMITVKNLDESMVMNYYPKYQAYIINDQGKTITAFN